MAMKNKSEVSIGIKFKFPKHCSICLKICSPTDLDRLDITQDQQIMNKQSRLNNVPNTIQLCPKSRDLLASNQSSEWLQPEDLYCFLVNNLGLVQDCACVCVSMHPRMHTHTNACTNTHTAAPIILTNFISCHMLLVLN